MTPERFEKIERVFRAALEKAPSERGLFLDDACRDDPGMRREVDSLLASHEDAGSFLDRPAFAAAAGAGPIRMFLPNQLVADRFRIVRFLAEGGMGEVYEALDTVTDERVALKTVRPSMLDDGEAEERFLRESKLARKVTHANVCRTFDVFEHRISLGRSETSIRFLTMELLSGETLGQRLRRSGSLGSDRALPIARQIAAALAAAHDVGVVHRDLKPDNVVLVPGRDRARAVVTDFGLARENRALEAAPPESRGELLWILHGLQAEANAPKGALARIAKRARRQMAALGIAPGDGRLLTEMGRVMGTPAYMSPEQAQGERGDERSDVWSFGVVFYEMLTGKLPYRPVSSFRRLLRKLTRRAPSPASIGRSVPSAVRDVIFRCLALERAERYASAVAVLQALDRATAQPSSSRHRLARAALYALLAVLSAAALIALLNL